MINQEKEKRLSELTKDEAFLEKLANTKSQEEVEALLMENGVELTSDEIDELIEGGKDFLEKEGYLTTDGELSEKGLEMVSGGVNWAAAFCGTAIVAASAWFTAPVGLVVGAVMVSHAIIY